MTKQQEELIKAKLLEELNRAELSGLATGSKTVSKVIYDKVAAVDKSYSKRDLLRIVADVKEFCEKGLAIKQEK